MDNFHFTCKYFKDLINIKQYALSCGDINNNYTGFVFTKSLWIIRKRFIKKNKGNIIGRTCQCPISDSTKHFRSSQGEIMK